MGAQELDVYATLTDRLRITLYIPRIYKNEKWMFVLFHFRHPDQEFQGRERTENLNLSVVSTVKFVILEGKQRNRCV